MVFIFSEVFAWECKPIGVGRILILSLRNGFMFLYSNDTLSGRCLVMLSHACGSATCVAWASAESCNQEKICILLSMVEVLIGVTSPSSCF